MEWAGARNLPPPTKKRITVEINPPSLLKLLHTWFAIHRRLVNTRLVSTFHSWLKHCSYLSSFGLFSFMSRNLIVTKYHIKFFFVKFKFYIILHYDIFCQNIFPIDILDLRPSSVLRSWCWTRPLGDRRNSTRSSMWEQANSWTTITSTPFT